MKWKSKVETEETPFNHIKSVDVAQFVHQRALSNAPVAKWVCNTTNNNKQLIQAQSGKRVIDDLATT